MRLEEVYFLKSLNSIFVERMLQWVDNAFFQPSVSFLRSEYISDHIRCFIWQLKQIIAQFTEEFTSLVAKPLSVSFGH